MAADLILRLLAEDGTDCAWRAADGARGDGGRGRLADAAAAAAGGRTRLVVPGTSVLLTRAAVPAGNRARAQSAIPWALEDRLVEDVADLHFALGGRLDDGWWPVAVVARARMDAWLARCAEVGVQPHSVVPEPLALPLPEPGKWVACAEADRVNVRTGPDTGFTCEPELLPAVAAGLAVPERIRLLGSDTPYWPQAHREVLAPAEPLPADDPAAAFTGAVAAAGIDLLQGTYSPRERTGRALRRWRAPAIVALVALAATVAHLAFDYAALGARERTLRTRLEAVFRETFPGVQRVADPRAQMAARLRSLRSGADGEPRFATLAAAAGAALDGREGVALTRLTWRDGTLELDLEASDLQLLDRVRRALIEAGFGAEIRAAERSGERIEGRIRVTGDTA